MTGVAGVGNGFDLLAKRELALKSFQAQKDAVIAKLAESQDKVTYQQGEVTRTKEQLADYVVALQNLKEPDKVDEPGKEPVKEDYKKEETWSPTSEEVKSSVVYNKDNDYDMNKFNVDHKEWEEKDAAYKQYQKDLEDYNNQKSALEEQINSFKAIDADNENFLNNLIGVAKEAEQAVIENQTGIDINTGDIENLNAQLAEAKFEVKAGDGGNNGMVAATFSDLQKAGVIPKDAKPGDYSKEQLQEMCKQLVTADNENNGTNYNVNGNDRHYKTMSADAASTYTYEQMDHMAEALGLGGGKGIDLEDGSFGLSMADLDKLGNEYAANKAYDGGEIGEVTVVGHSSVKTPRGIHYQDLNSDGTEKPEDERRDFNRLSTHGLTAKTTTDAEGNETVVKDDKGRTIYVRIGSDGKPLANSREFNSDEVNEYFRGIENSVASGYSRVLNKAEKYGVDIDATTNGITNGKEAKQALNDAIDVKKAEQKYKDEIKQYGINTEGMSAKEIKNAVKQAKKGNYDSSVIQAQHTVATPVTDKPPVYADGGDETLIKAEPAVTAPETNHPPVIYNPDDSSEGTTVKSGVPTTAPKDNVAGQTTGNLTKDDIDKKIKDLKPGETYTYSNTTSVKSSDGSFSSRTVKTITWQRQEDGTLTCRYIDGGYRADTVTDTYDNNQRLISTTRKNIWKPFNNTTTTYGADGKVQSQNVDLSGLSNSSQRNISSLPKEYQVTKYLKQNQTKFPTQTVKDDAGREIIKLKDGQYYNSKGKPIDTDKAVKLISKALKDGTLSNIDQIK